MTERNLTSARLKEALLEELLNRVENGEATLTKDGEQVTIPAPASTLSAAINFLKQFPPDDITRTGELSDTLRRYQSDMPFK